MSITAYLTTLWHLLHVGSRNVACVAPALHQVIPAIDKTFFPYLMLHMINSSASADWLSMVLLTADNGGLELGNGAASSCEPSFSLLDPHNS